MTLLDIEADVTARTFRPASTLIAWWLVGRWLAVFDIAMFVVLVVALLVDGLTTTVAISAEVAFGGLLFLFVILFVGPRTRRNKAMNEGHMHFVADEEGYFVEGPFGTQTIRWPTYKKACVDRRYIYLFLTNRLAQVIPLELVPDAGPLLDHLRKLNLLRPTPRTFILF
ncbi:MAG TPA: YcxB family protein [Candidatus Acidoferrum sp.]|jgi:hypothetical protein|nr:YcxB family protein [Candidatus Acidoferrum sp.]